MLRIILLCTLIACATSQNLPKEEKRTISIQGSAEIELKPDMIIWKTSIEAIEKDVIESREKVDQIVSSVTSKLIRLGIKKNGIKIYNNRQNKHRVYNQKKKKYELKGYRISLNIDITSYDIKLFQEVNNILLEANEIRVSSTNYDSSKKDDYDLKILSAAASDALQKATAIATPLGVKIGKPVSISVYNSGRASKVYTRGGRAAESKIMVDSGVQIEDHVGKLTIRRSLNITFELLD